MKHHILGRDHSLPEQLNDFFYFFDGNTLQTNVLPHLLCVGQTQSHFFISDHDVRRLLQCQNSHLRTANEFAAIISYIFNCANVTTCLVCRFLSHMTLDMQIGEWMMLSQFAAFYNTLTVSSPMLVSYSLISAQLLTLFNSSLLTLTVLIKAFVCELPVRAYKRLVHKGTWTEKQT